MTAAHPPESGGPRHERLLGVLCAATFLVFFQAFMIAPLLPLLSRAFGASPQAVALAVPAYMIPYGISTLFYGLVSDRLGRRRIVLGSLLAFSVLTALTASAQSGGELVLWRLLTGLGASGVVPLALALVGQHYPFDRRGRPLGWLFGAMAGGMAFGSSLGALLEPLVGWRAIFLGVGGLGLLVLALLLPYRGLLGEPTRETAPPLRQVLTGYATLLGSPRGRTTYGYVFVNSVFHAGVFTWLGLYFSERHGLGEVGIGLALLGYGVPGFLLGPVIGRAADRWGRRWLIPAGLVAGAAGAAGLILDLPLLAAAAAVTVLSLGYDMTQPLLAGIVTDLGGKRPGQAMGLNVFMLFTGMGVGSVLFGESLRMGFGPALGVFTVVQFAGAALAIRLFHSERPPRPTPGAG